MKKLLPLLLLISTFTIAQDYTITPWFEGRKSAVILTFDDALPEHPEFVIPLMNQYDFDGTFYINTLNDYAWATAAYLEGHEIGNHTANHPHLLTLNAASLKEQISDFRDTLILKTGAEITTVAYPFGEGSEIDSGSFEVQDTTANYHIAGRGVYAYDVQDWIYDFDSTSRSYYQIKSTSGAINNWENQVDNVVENGGLLPFFYHAVGSPAGFDNVSEEDFTAQLDYLKAKEKGVWVTTLSNAVKYHKQRKTAVLTTVSAPFHMADNWRLSLSDNLNDEVFNYPLTVKLTIPDSITAVMAIEQAGVELDFEIDADTLIFSAVPDGGDIDLSILNCTQPNVQLSVMGADTFCLPDSVVYEATMHQDYVYSWYKNDTLLNNTTNELIVKEEGVYYSKVELEGCPIELEERTVSITGDCGVPIVDFKVNKEQQFKNTTVVFSSETSNLEGTEKFYWDFGTDASIPAGYYGAGPHEVSYSSSGLKTVSLTVEGSVTHVTESKIDFINIVDYDACHAFKEDFNGEDVTVVRGGWSDYSFDGHNYAFRITTRDNGGNEWYLVDYFFHDNGVKKLIDFSDPFVDPVLKFRMKATDTCRVWVSVLDENNVANAGMAISAEGGLDLSTEYQEFEVDFSKLFYHEWDNLDVDSTKISAIRFAINGGFASFPFTNKYGQVINSHFAGSVDIDWISVGGDCQFDSLFANIVVPDFVHKDSSFTLWNHSNPSLVGATLEWNFGNNAKDSVLTAYDESPFTNSYSTVGKKTITLKVTTASGQVYEVEEFIEVIDPTIGIEEVIGETIIVNPISDRVQGIIHSNSKLDISLSLLDLNGRVITHELGKLRVGENQINLPISSLSKGYYLLKIDSELGSKTIKLFK